jgi:hypothetical protein
MPAPLAKELRSAHPPRYLLFTLPTRETLPTPQPTWADNNYLHPSLTMPLSFLSEQNSFHKHVACNCINMYFVYISGTGLRTVCRNADADAVGLDADAQLCSWLIRLGERGTLGV